MSKDQEEKSLSELCAPLSAKVMPRSALHNVRGSPLSEEKARQLQGREQGKSQPRAHQRILIPGRSWGRSE